MRVLDLLLGRPLASDEARGEQIGSWVGIPESGLDALSSVRDFRTGTVSDAPSSFLSRIHRGKKRIENVRKKIAALG